MKKKMAILITTIIVIVASAILIFNFVTGPKVNLLLQQETEAENLWKSKGITSYSIEVEYEPITPYKDVQIHRVTVKNSVVVAYEHICEKSPFRVDITRPCQKEGDDPDGYTVQGLFFIAKSKAIKNAEHREYVLPTVLRYDRDLGYPVDIFFDPYLTSHDEESWKVKSFQTLN